MFNNDIEIIKHTIMDIFKKLAFYHAQIKTCTKLFYGNIYIYTINYNDITLKLC